MGAFTPSYSSWLRGLRLVIVWLAAPSVWMKLCRLRCRSPPRHHVSDADRPLESLPARWSRPALAPGWTRVVLLGGRLHPHGCAGRSRQDDLCWNAGASVPPIVRSGRASVPDNLCTDARRSAVSCE